MIFSQIMKFSAKNRITVYVYFYRTKHKFKNESSTYLKTYSKTDTEIKINLLIFRHLVK